MSTYQSDAKTLIRHAMQALDDEFGVDESWPFVKRLLAIFNDIRDLEDAKAKNATRSIAANVSVDRPRLVKGSGGSAA